MGEAVTDAEVIGAVRIEHIASWTFVDFADPDAARLFARATGGLWSGKTVQVESTQIDAIQELIGLIREREAESLH